MKLSYLTMTNYQGPAPGLELWPVPPSVCNPQIAQQSMATAIDLAVTAENLGFDWVSVAEHHYAAYMMTPNPIIMAAALSQVIKKAKIALLGPLVPLNNPIRLAEEVAMLDNLNNGRTVVLFLRGTPNEHNTYDSPKETTREMTQEGIDLIIKSWKEPSPFAWQGSHYQFSTISVWPKVLQSPHPPMYGSGNSPESVIFAAQRKMGIAFSFAPLEMVKNLVERYYSECEKAGWQPTAEHVLYRGIACIYHTDAEAKAIFTQSLGRQALEKNLDQTNALGGPPVNELITEPYFLGGIDTIIQRFEALKACGVGVTDMGFSIGSVAQQKESMKIFAEHVMPKVQS